MGMGSCQRRIDIWDGNTVEDAKKNINIYFNYIQVARVDLDIMRFNKEYGGITDRDLVSITWELAVKVTETFGTDDQKDALEAMRKSRNRKKKNRR